MTNRQYFLAHVGQTSMEPMAFEIASAKDCTLMDVNEKKYLDAIGGIAVANIGHSNADVLAAVDKQMKLYTHTMVYGEMVQAPQVRYAKLLTDNLPASLNNVFFTNSGAEAIEGAMKLSKRFTNKSKILVCNKSYHGSTQGALSLIGDEYWRNAYRPLLPDVYHFNYNSDALLDAIDSKTACVILEPVQAESGIIPANIQWIQAIAAKCKSVNALLVLDESQTGFGRTGTLWGFSQYNIIPDVLVLAKAIGGGMPLGAFIADKSIMQTLAHAPVLGHLSTFGGHPVSCVAGEAALTFLLQNNLLETIETKGALLEKLLQHKHIICHSRIGLWMSLFLKDTPTTLEVVKECLLNGVFTDWFLFASNAIRISPPLIITEQEIETMCKIILQSVDNVAARDSG